MHVPVCVYCVCLCMCFRYLLDYCIENPHEKNTLKGLKVLLSESLGSVASNLAPQKRKNQNLEKIIKELCC